MTRSSHVPFATDPEFKSCLRDCSIMDATHKLDVSWRFSRGRSSPMINRSFDLVFHKAINAIQSTMNYQSYFIGILKQSYLLPLVLSCFYSHRSTCHVVLPRDGGDDFFVKIPHDTSQITWRDPRDWHAPETEVLYCHMLPGWNPVSKKSEVEHVEHWTWNSRFGKKEWLIDWFINCLWS